MKFFFFVLFIQQTNTYLSVFFHIYFSFYFSYLQSLFCSNVFCLLKRSIVKKKRRKKHNFYLCDRKSEGDEGRLKLRNFKIKREIYLFTRITFGCFRRIKERSIYLCVTNSSVIHMCAERVYF